MIPQRALRAATIALYAIAAGVAMPAVLPAQDLGCDRGDLEVRSLEFRGNRAVSDNDLELRVATTATARARRVFRLPLGAKRCLNREELPRDVIGLRIYYQNRGFYMVQVDTIVTPVGRDGVRVVFVIEEGAPTLLRSYDVRGLTGIPDSAAMIRNLQLRVGQPFDINLLRADMDTIVQRLRNSGFYRAELFHEYSTNRDSLFATASLTVVPGVRARFGPPVIEVDPVPGRDQQIPDDVVARVMGIVSGARYSDRAIVDAQRSLFGLGTYRHIEVAPLPDSLQPPGDSIVVLRVLLREDYMKQLDSEFGWATLDCGRVRLQYTDRNWMGTARRMEMTGQLSKIGYGHPLRSEFTRRICELDGRSPLRADSAFSDRVHYYTGISLRQPRLLGFRWMPTIALYSERRGEYTAYLRSTYVGADLSATREIGFRTPFRLGYTVEYGRTEAPDAALCALFNRCDRITRDELDSLATLGVASASVVRLRTDNPVSPSRGNAMRAELRSSASRLLGTSPNLYFDKATGDVAFYRAVGRGNVLALRLRGGVVVGRKDATDRVGFVPPQERLYAGGATSVRGFQQNELGALVYIAGADRIDSTVVSVVGNDTTFRMQVPDSAPRISRTVPLGGNSLAVVNLDYRIQDPFFFPDLLQYTVFLDGGQVWTRKAGNAAIGWTALKWTPGVGIRALTPVGPVQMNVGYNRHRREQGAIFFNPDVAELLCVTRGNTIDLRRNADGNLEQVDRAATCPATFNPPERKTLLQRLTFTFSIGPDF